MIDLLELVICLYGCVVGWACGETERVLGGEDRGFVCLLLVEA
jgi:hypothetical protein